MMKRSNEPLRSNFLRVLLQALQRRFEEALPQACRGKRLSGHSLQRNAYRDAPTGLHRQASCRGICTGQNYKICEGHFQGYTEQSLDVLSYSSTDRGVCRGTPYRPQSVSKIMSVYKPTHAYVEPYRHLRTHVHIYISPHTYIDLFTHTEKY